MIVVGSSGKEGDGIFFKFSATIDGRCFTKLTFSSIGCPWSMGIGMILCGLIENRPFSEALDISAVDVQQRLLDLPRSRLELLRAGIEAVHGLARASLESQSDPGMGGSV